ncbi:MAG: tRNA (adenosine(37)-N6)-threonylcarbamoyltransferase complex ATPase subunit type 1 TsaE [Anaerolineae bacterium]
MTERTMSITLYTTSPEQTRSLGRSLGKLLQAGDIVCLQGDLGSGKTCMAQGIGSGMGVAGVINSPTFVFVNEHAPVTRGPYFYHIDLYRICDLTEALTLGLEDYMYGDGVTVIEWADRAKEMMPSNCLWVRLTYRDYTERRLTLEAIGERYIALLQALVQDPAVASAQIEVSA